jgi:hypothetical protein
MQIVSKDLSEPVRSHKDLDKDAAPHFQKAVKFYDGLAKQLVNQGHVLDVFASALDQVSILFSQLYIPVLVLRFLSCSIDLHVAIGGPCRPPKLPPMAKARR